MSVEDSLTCGERLHLHLWLAPLCGWDANGQHPVLFFVMTAALLPCCLSSQWQEETHYSPGVAKCCFPVFGWSRRTGMTEAGFDICLAFTRFISAVFVSCCFLIICVGTTWFTRFLGLKGESAACASQCRRRRQRQTGEVQFVSIPRWTVNSKSQTSKHPPIYLILRVSRTPIQTCTCLYVLSAGIKDMCASTT